MDQEFQKAPQKSEAGYLYRRTAHFIDKVFKVANPADLPINRPIKFEFVINLKTAKALGLTIGPTLIAQADEVIE